MTTAVLVDLMHACTLVPDGPHVRSPTGLQSGRLVVRCVSLLGDGAEQQQTDSLANVAGRLVRFFGKPRSSEALGKVEYQPVVVVVVL